MKPGYTRLHFTQQRPPSPMTEKIFNPFTDRLSRDIRNTLSSSLVECLEAGNISSAEEVAKRYLAEHPAPLYSEYIQQRLQLYKEAVKTIHGGSEDPIWRSTILWNLGLFFEMHEVLEHAWYSAQGDTKLIMQALIRAAGVYVKLGCGYKPQARKMADKAIDVLTIHQEFLSDYFQPEPLLKALRELDPQPPELVG